MSEAHNRASIKYNKKMDSITIRPSKEIGAAIRSAAAEAGQPVQRYIIEATQERMERERNTRDI